MLLKPFSVAALVAASATTTNGFLIPPQLSEVDIEIVEIEVAKGPLLTIPEKVAVDVDCPGCSLEVEGQGAATTLNPAPPNHLELTFTVDHTTKTDRLLVNGFEIYPSADPFQSLYAYQALDNDGKEKREERVKILPQRLGYSLQVQTPDREVPAIIPYHMKDNVLELFIIDLQIIEVGDKFVKGIPNVQVKLIEAIDGKLVIGAVETTASQNPDTTDGEKEGEECNTLMCKWIAYAQDKVKQMKDHMKPKPCHGDGMHKGWGMGHGMGHGHHGGPPHGHHGQEHGHGHHDDNNNQPPPHFSESNGNHHSIAKLFKNIASHILLPVLIGVVAGVSVSLIGMVIGTLVVSTWRAFRCSSTDAPALKEDASQEEKSGLIEHQDPPPGYDEAADEQDVKKLDV